MKTVIGLGLFGLLLVGCNMNIDSPQTPTIAPTATQDLTAIAQQVTKTPTRVPPFNTPTVTSTRTASPTNTLTDTPSATPTATVTDTATATHTQQPTDRPTATPSNTPRPSRTPTRTPRPTEPATGTPTEAVAQLDIPTATQPPTQTFTPFPTRTPSVTGVAATPDDRFPTATQTPGGIYTLTPVPPSDTPSYIPTLPIPGEGGTFYDPNAPDDMQGALPIAPVGETGPSGPVMPEQQSIVISYAGQVVPLLTLNAGVGGSALAQADIFAVSSTGQVAAVGYDRWLYVGGGRMEISPSSRYGTNTNLRFGDLVWSPDSQRIAIRVDAVNPDDPTAFDSGIWIYEPGSNRSWQVFRNTYEAAQRGDQRLARTVQWSPNGSGLIVAVDTPLGPANVFMSLYHDANEPINAIPYEDATWAPDTGSLIVSGRTWNGPSVIGRVMVDANWTYIEYLNQATSGLYMQDAIQLADGRIAFLGTQATSSFALYTMQPMLDAEPVRLSNLISGQVASAEWNAGRTAVLVTVQTGTGYQLWIIRTDGTAQNATPAAGVPTTAHWR